MTATGKVHRSDLDLLKGFAILAVMLYHMGISRSGYLGVDAFFVINGFLVVPKVVDAIGSGTFRYFRFMEKRTVRLLPLMLLVSLLALLAGYRRMLPDDYENLAEAVVATNFFSNNLLAYINTDNYWNVVNEYKALMHTWYIGVLFEFYLFFPLVLMLVKWLSQRLRFSFGKYAVVALLSLSIVSALLYLDPSASTAGRFYLIQYRFYELAFGGLAGMWIARQRKGRLYADGFMSGAGFVAWSLILFAGIVYVGGQEQEYSLVTGTVKEAESLVPQSNLLLLTVVLTILLLLSDNTRSRLVSLLIGTKVMCLAGMMSYSLFIWHQPILAFWRYFVTARFSPAFVLLFFVAVFALSYATYRLVEQRVRAGVYTRVVTLLAFVFINGAAFMLYMRAGVVSDIPELDIRVDSVRRNMHAEYVDRLFSYDRDFPEADNGRANVLVIGNSFARDWGNILLESEVADRINLSYVPCIEERHAGRIGRSDYVFIHDWKHNVPYYVWESVRPDAEVWGIGTKSFGECVGIVYKNRHRPGYFRQSVSISPGFAIANEQMKGEWKDKYIDLLGMSLVGKDRVAVFSQDGKLISQDTRHLTKGGAKYFADRIDFCRIFGESKETTPLTP